MTGIPLEGSIWEYAARDPLPIPMPEDREGYHGQRHLDYWLSGLNDYLLIRSALASHGVTFQPGLTLLDFGCSSGRVLRHFLCQQQGLELWGVDPNGRSIDWMLDHLGPRLRAVHTTLLPILPVEDNSISAAYALSVFTHIDEFELAWLAELRRALKPGGIAYVSVQTERTWNALNDHQQLYHSLMGMRNSAAGETVSAQSLQNALPSRRAVFRSNMPTARPHECHVFFSSDYLADVWGRFFDILELRRAASDYQDVVVMKKK